jgi:hypothetical protein
MATRLIGDQEAPVRMSTWYQKQQATFSDTMALVRRYLWGVDHFPLSHAPTDVVNIPPSLLERFTDALCDAA